MSSKNKILEAIRKAKPDSIPPPQVPAFAPLGDDKLSFFQQMVEVGKGKVDKTTDERQLEQEIKKLFPEAERIASTIPTIAGNYDLAEVKKPVDLKAIDVAIIKGQFGVAENGAIWVTEAECVHRVLPFITQHLVILLNPKDIVWNMHEAYQRAQIDDTGFGVFIAGPSKTADIEQSLVIGAQGPRSLTVILLNA